MQIDNNKDGMEYVLNSESYFRKCKTFVLDSLHSKATVRQQLPKENFPVWYGINETAYRTQSQSIVIASTFNQLFVSALVIKDKMKIS